MSDIFSEQLGFVFNADEQNEDAAAKWNWAVGIFGDPLTETPRLPTKKLSLFSETYEGSIYSDWQTRDSTIGYHILESLIPKNKLALLCYRNGITKRHRAISITRSRFKTLSRMNQAETNPAFKHPQELLDLMEREIAETSQELEYLSNFNCRMDSLASVIELLEESEENVNHILNEQLFRLIGMGWKGQAKITAFRNRFPNYRYRIGQEANVPIHFTLSGSRGAADKNIVLNESTAAYILHLLETIAALAAESEPLFDAKTRPQCLSKNWPPPLMMLRGIVELFYFCNFEIPYTHSTIYLDRDDPNRLWLYNGENSEWQSTGDESLGERLKRHAAHIITLLASPPPFLNCVDIDDLSRICKTAIASAKAPPSEKYHPYFSVGLAQLDFDPSGHDYKFRGGYELSAQLIEQIVSSQPNLDRVFRSSVGGPLQTLLSMAQLEQTAFNRPAEDALPDNIKFELLGRFWRLLAKKRPLILLGRDYAKSIHAGMAAAGQSAPERSGMLSMHLSSVFTRTVFGKIDQPVDPLNALSQSDRVRIIALINVSRLFVEESLARLTPTTDSDSLAKAINSFSLSTEQEVAIASGFNNEWLDSTQPMLGLLRLTAPEAWIFWAQIHKKTPFDSILSSRNPENALSKLFVILSDFVRLVLLLEVTSPTIAESLSENAEKGASELFSAFAPYTRLPTLRLSMDYYFDPEFQHDNWLAFTVSFKKHLDRLSVSLEKISGTESQLNALHAAVIQLKAQYPDIITASNIEVMSASTAVSSDTDSSLQPEGGKDRILSTIDEATACSIESICRGLIGAKFSSNDDLLMIIGLARMPGAAENLQWIARAAESLQSAISDRLRRLVFSSPSALHCTVSLLSQSLPGGQASRIEEGILTQLLDYLNQLDHFNEYVGQLLGESAFCDEDSRGRFSRSAFSENRNDAEFFLCSVSGQTLCSFALANNEEHAIESVKKSIMARIDGTISSWRPEILLLGGGKLHASENRITLTGATQLNPIFAEPSGASSSRLIWYALRSRFESAMNIFRNEQPGLVFEIGI